ncbi:hypothetical protein ESA94_07855 [Lacibacter luteus]|uniref:DUF4468 domain-containing protein n=1 Tax=Lacibacter luteus TaxID=2508719 RepID=A0A4V1M7K3_9BACT|nr:hypothetical protein [Lacibacter luteus]RXK60375.1 hypothetical protein ESA94_07855 [Lacibacter luteus]
MKHFLHLFFLLPVFSFAQNDSLIEYSRLVKMTMRPDAFVKLHYDTIGSTEDVHIGLITATSLKDGSAERSVCFVSRGILSTFISFNERNIQISIEDLSSFINALVQLNAETDIKNSREFEIYRYVSSNFTVLEMQNRHFNTKRWDLTLYTRYRDINAAVPGMSISFSQKSLGSLLSVLQQLKKDLGDDLYKKL